MGGYIYKGHKHDDDDKQDILVKVEVGVVIALCGLFLTFVPHPTYATAGRLLLAVGGELAGDGILERMEEDRKRENTRNKIIGLS